MAKVNIKDGNLDYVLPPEGCARFEAVPYFFTKNGCVITFEDIRTVNGKRKVERFQYIPSRVVREVAERTLAGVEYRFASALYDLPRDQVAFIHINAEKVIAMQGDIAEYRHGQNSDEGWKPL